MRIFYSPQQNGFFIEGINSSMPEDVVEISQERYEELFSDPAKEIKNRGGLPAAYSRPKAEFDPVAARSSAYRLESDPLFIEWQYDQTPESEKVWRDKVAEIKDRYPLPAVS